ncbi:MAG: manganese efflux pump [Lachnospiraceae bacterium]|nr:manganese efflux pump [Lachnospiraceae bacterium]
MFNILILVFALCLDTFVASAAYGTNRVSLSRGKIAAINGICSLCLGLSLLFGSFLDSRIPETFTKEICFFSLLTLGCLKLMNSSIRQYLRRHKAVHKNISFSVSNLRFIVDIYGDPMEADANQKHSLSWKEVIFFSLAMSIDSLISGTMAAFLKIPVFLTVAACFLVGELLTYLGLYLGNKISSRCPQDLSWIGGILFIVLAVVKSR